MTKVVPYDRVFAVAVFQDILAGSLDATLACGGVNYVPSTEGLSINFVSYVFNSGVVETWERTVPHSVGGKVVEKTLEVSFESIAEIVIPFVR